MGPPEIEIVPWARGDLPLLWRANTPQMTAHLGGPEPDEKVLDRHERYLRLPETGGGQVFSVVVGPEREQAGGVGYWERTWRGETVYETGWNVLPEFQGRGIAAAAARLAAEHARARRRRRWLHAFPSAGNPGSNGVCRRAGFELLGECEFEYPPGRLMRCHDWRLSLA